MRPLSPIDPTNADLQAGPRPSPRSTLGVLLLMTLVWGLLLSTARDLAMGATAIEPAPFVKEAIAFGAMLGAVYRVNVAAAPFTVALGIFGSWSFYFIGGYRAAIIFCCLPLLSFVPFALAQLIVTLLS